MRRKRVPIILLFVIVASMLMSFVPASAGEICGYVRYYVFGQGPYYVPGITYCDRATCVGAIGQGPNRAWVWPFVIETFECARGF